MPLKSEGEKKPKASRHEEQKVKFSQATNTGSCAKQACTDLVRARVTFSRETQKGSLSYCKSLSYCTLFLLNALSLTDHAPLAQAPSNCKLSISTLPKCKPSLIETPFNCKPFLLNALSY